MKRLVVVGTGGAGLGIASFAPAAVAAEGQTVGNRPAELLPTTSWAALAVVAAAGVIWFAFGFRTSIATRSPAKSAGDSLVLLLGIATTIGLGALAVAASNPTSAEAAQATSEIETVPARGSLDAIEPTSQPNSDTSGLSPTPRPAATPRPTATPRPVATPIPTGAPQFAAPRIDHEPVQPSVAAGVFAPRDLEGSIHVPVASGVQFVLGSRRTVNINPGLTAVYQGSDRNGEVDIFAPYSVSSSGERVRSAAQALAVLRATPLNMVQQETLLVDGYDTVHLVGDPQLATLERIFETSAQSNTASNGGWWAASGAIHAWVIDAPDGPIIVTADSRLRNQRVGFDAVVAMAEDILFTMTILWASSG